MTLGVDQEPDYLNPDIPYGDEKLYTLKLRNSNPTNPLQASSFHGIPVLPTLDPWVVTFGAWEINVEGEFVKFEVFDGDDETHPNPIFVFIALFFNAQVASAAENDYGIVQAWFNNSKCHIKNRRKCICKN